MFSKEMLAWASKPLFSVDHDSALIRGQEAPQGSLACFAPWARAYRCLKKLVMR